MVKCKYCGQDPCRKWYRPRSFPKDGVVFCHNPYYVYTEELNYGKSPDGQ